MDKRFLSERGKTGRTLKEGKERKRIQKYMDRRENVKKAKKINTYQICFVAMAVGINVAGGQIALLLRLPVYLDSIGTILTGAVLGPWFGIIPNLLSGIFMGMTVDIYSLYFAPVGMVTGFISGWIFRKISVKKAAVFLAAGGIAIPGTLVSSVINAAVFGGVTSAGSSVLVQLLARTPLGLTGSIFAVQILTDYLDRCISLFVVSMFVSMLGHELRQKLAGGVRKHGAV